MHMIFSSSRKDKALSRERITCKVKGIK